MKLSKIHGVMVGCGTSQVRVPARESSVLTYGFRDLGKKVKMLHLCSSTTPWRRMGEWRKISKYS